MKLPIRGGAGMCARAVAAVGPQWRLPPRLAAYALVVRCQPRRQRATVYTLRCTRRLLRRLPFEPTESPPRPTTLLGDWYANVLFLGRSQLVLCTNERSLLSVIVPLKDAARLPIRLREAAASLLRSLGHPARAVTKEAKGMSELAIGRAVNRSVLGSMNDIARECRWYASQHGALDLTELELELTEMPMLSMEPSFSPQQAARLLGGT